MGYQSLGNILIQSSNNENTIILINAEKSFNKISFIIKTFSELGIEVNFLNLIKTIYKNGFSGSSVVKSLPANAGDMDLIPGSGRSAGVGNRNPLQYSCLENSMDRGAL